MPSFLIDESRDVVLGTDLIEHPEHRLVRPPVPGTIESGRGGRQAGIRIAVGTPDAPHGTRRTILLMVGVQDKEHIHGPLQHGIRRVGSVIIGEDHPQEIRREAQARIRVET